MSLHHLKEIESACNADNICYCYFFPESYIISLMSALGEFDCIDLFAGSSVIEEGLRRLLQKGFRLGMIDIDGTHEAYDGEYCMSVNKDKTIWVEPALRKWGDKWKPITSEALYAIFCDRGYGKEIGDITFSKSGCKNGRPE